MNKICIYKAISDIRNSPYTWASDPDATFSVNSVNEIHCVTLADAIMAYFQNVNTKQTNKKQ